MPRWPSRRCPRGVCELNLSAGVASKGRGPRAPAWGPQEPFGDQGSRRPLCTRWQVRAGSEVLRGPPRLPPGLLGAAAPPPAPPRRRRARSWAHLGCSRLGAGRGRGRRPSCLSALMLQYVARPAPEQEAARPIREVPEGGGGGGTPAGPRALPATTAGLKSGWHYGAARVMRC